MTPLGKAGPRVLVAALYAVLTVLLTYPLILHLTTHHVGESGGDARVYLWNLWWVKTALLKLHSSPLQTDYIFYPTGIGLALHTLALGQGLLFIPLSALFGDVAGANAIVLSTFLASSLGAYALARHLGAGREGAFLAGLVFAFCPYRLARLAGHYDLLSTEWIPLYGLALSKALETDRGRWRWVLVAGLLGGACGYVDLTYLVFLAVVSIVVLAFRRPWRERRLLPRAGAVAVLVVAILLPLLLSAWRDAKTWRYAPYPGSDRYVADLIGYVTPGPRQTILGDRIGRAFESNVTETTVFAGWTTLVLAGLALSRKDVRRVLAPWIVLGAIAFALSLGDSLHLAGHDSGVPMPFALVRRLPPLEHLRAPSRFAILVVLALALLVAAAWTRGLERAAGTRSRLALTALAGAAIAAEAAALPVPMFAAGAPAVFAAIGREAGDFTVLEIPGIDQIPGQLMYRQTIHGKRILIGTAARVPIEKASYFFGLPLVRPLVDLRKGKLSLDDAMRPETLGPTAEAARFLGVRYIVIERAFEGRGIARFLEAALPTERIEGDPDRIVLRVRPEGLPSLPSTLEAGASASRLYFESGWSTPEADGPGLVRRALGTRSTLLFRRPADGAGDVVLTLGSVPAGEALRVDAWVGGQRVGIAPVLVGGASLRWPLLAGPLGGVERMELLWSGPGARVAAVRFEVPDRDHRAAALHRIEAGVR